MNEYEGLIGCTGQTYQAPSAATRYVLETAIKQLGFPSLYALTKAIDASDPVKASHRWGNGGGGISAFYMVRIMYLLELRTHDPDYWTPAKLSRIDWSSVEHHDHAIPLSVVTERANAKRQNVLSARRAGVPYVPSKSNRPVIAGSAA